MLEELLQKMKSNSAFTLEHSLKTTWSGGTTSQLYIFPEDAQFSDRNFDFRISSATIDVEESSFTSLPTYNRILAILEGNLTLNHVGKPLTQLTKYEHVFFHGSWKTTSIGKVRDFNVIYNENYHVDFQLISVETQQTITKNTEFLFVFCLLDESIIDLKSICKHTLIQVKQKSIKLNNGIYFVIQLEQISESQAK